MSQLELLRPQADYYNDPADQVAMTVFNRRYPTHVRKSNEPPSIIPPPLGELVGAVMKLIAPPVLQSRKNVGRERLYEAFDRGCTALDWEYGGVSTFIAAITECNVEIRTASMESRHTHKLMLQKLNELEAIMPQLAFRRPAVIRAELDAMPEFVIRTAIENALRASAEELVLATLEMLDRLVSMQMVGLRIWTSDTSCRFHFFRHVVIEEAKETRRTKQQSSRIVTERATPQREINTVHRTERDFELTHRHSRQIHEVVLAKNHALPARHVRRPDRVNNLLEAMPAFMRPHGRIITGQEVHRTIIEQDLRKESSTEVEEKAEIKRIVLYRPDPAVVFCHYVLTGWGDEEMTTK